MTRSLLFGLGLLLLATYVSAAAPAKQEPTTPKDSVLLNAKGDGYHGIWYFNEEQHDKYVYKYAGGLGTFCSSHNPFAVYCKEVDKTFFCWGGARKGDPGALLQMVSYYDHKTGRVPRPTILLDKHTEDAHDTPIISVDAKGYIWIFSSAHGSLAYSGRPAYISVSKKPYDIDEFELVSTGSYSYPQVYYFPGRGFVFMQTHYDPDPLAPGAERKLYCSSGPDGRQWTKPILYAAIENGDYQVSWTDGKKVGGAFNYHPTGQGLNWRSNLYYVESADFGKTWHNAQGNELKIPLLKKSNPALVHDYRSEGLNVYVMDLNFDAEGRPIILYLTSKGWQAGPRNDPRMWRTARWTGTAWDLQGAIRSDSNYDMGSLWIEDGQWKIIGPTEDGPQAYGTGGEMAMWTSSDLGVTWKKRQLTHDSQYNHGYCRRPLNAHPDFYAFWTDGHGRQKSESRLYFTNRDGDHVWRLPTEMHDETAKPEIVW